MSNGVGGGPTPKGLAFLSAAGSVASIIALLVVLIQQAAREAGVGSQFMVWRLILTAIALVATGGIVVSAYGYCRTVQLSQHSLHMRVLRICLVSMIALLAAGVCLDGLFAALYWTPWMYLVVSLFR